MLSAGTDCVVSLASAAMQHLWYAVEIRAQAALSKINTKEGEGHACEHHCHHDCRSLGLSLSGRDPHGQVA